MGLPANTNCPEYAAHGAVDPSPGFPSGKWWASAAVVAALSVSAPTQARKARFG